MNTHEVLESADKLYRVLKLRTSCTCVYNIPYDHSFMDRVRTHKCQRCIVIENWEQLTHERSEVHCA